MNFGWSFCGKKGQCGLVYGILILKMGKKAMKKRSYLNHRTALIKLIVKHLILFFCNFYFN
jgi:hypothetical protein